jgi:MFS family permease
MTEPRFRDAIRHLPPTAWSLCLGTLVNRAGSFLPVFMVLYLTSRHHTPAEAGLVLTIAGLGSVAGNAVGGHVADRLGRRWTIAVSMLATAALTASFPLFDALPVLTVLAGLVGIASQLYRPAAGALLVDVTTPEQRLAAFAILRFAINVGAALGAALGGFLATRSYLVLFLGNSVACLLYGLTALALLRDVAAPAPRGTEEARPGYRTAVSDPRLLRFLAVAFVSEFVYIQSTVGLPLHVHEVGISPTGFGLLLALNGLVVLLLELPITSLVSRRPPAPVMMAGLLLTGAGFMLTGFATTLLQLAGTVLVWTLGEMVYTPVAAAYPSRLSPGHLRGRYQGLHGAAMTLGAAVGPLVGGLVFGRAEWALWALCAASCLGASRLDLTVAGISREPPGPARPGGVAASGPRGRSPGRTP